MKKRNDYKYDLEGIHVLTNGAEQTLLMI